MKQTAIPSLAFSFALLVGCSPPPTSKPAAKPAPVLVTAARIETVPIEIRSIGTVKTVATVAVRPRVGGQLMKVFFKEGDDVKVGQKLFQIDRAPFDAAVAEAEANLAKNKAILEGATVELRRVEAAGAAVAGTELDAARTTFASASASVLVDHATIATAKLQAGFTTISSPIDGRAGELLVNEGNLIDANSQTPMVVINQVSPIYVSFTLPEQQLGIVTEAWASKPLVVQAIPRAGDKPIVGKLAFIDNAVNTESGTVMLKAEFPNTDRRLWPGEFVDVLLTVRQRPESVVVPSAAVQTGQQGTYVYVVTAEKTVTLKPVSVAFEYESETVIASGLDGSETVVVEGQLRLTNGSKVDAKPMPKLPGDTAKEAAQ